MCRTLYNAFPTTARHHMRRLYVVTRRKKRCRKKMAVTFVHLAFCATGVRSINAVGSIMRTASAAIVCMCSRTDCTWSIQRAKPELKTSYFACWRTEMPSSAGRRHLPPAIDRALVSDRDTAQPNRFKFLRVTT